MNKITVIFTFFVSIANMHIYSRENLVLKSNIIEHHHIVDVENSIDNTPDYASNCKYSYSYVIIDLNKACQIDSIALKFVKNKKCDNRIIKIRILGSENNDNYSMLTSFGEHHWIEILQSGFNKTKVRYIKIEIDSREDCREFEYLCLDEIEVY